MPTTECFWSILFASWFLDSSKASPRLLSSKCVLEATDPFRNDTVLDDIVSELAKLSVFRARGLFVPRCCWRSSFPLRAACCGDTFSMILSAAPLLNESGQKVDHYQDPWEVSSHWVVKHTTICRPASSVKCEKSFGAQSTKRIVEASVGKRVRHFENAMVMLLPRTTPRLPLFVGLLNNH